MNNLKKYAKGYIRELTTLLALAAIVVIFSIIAPRYLEIGNLMDIVEQGTVNGFLPLESPAPSSPVALICPWALPWPSVS